MSAASWWARAVSRHRPGGASELEPPIDAVEEPRPRTAFVLLGGAARGAAQAGALAVLLEHGVVPDLIFGISAGAWNGAYIAADPSPARAAALQALWRAATSQGMLGPHWRMPFTLIGSRRSLYPSAGVQRIANRYLGEQTFEQLTVPLTIVAADLVSGDPVMFSTGPLVRAVLASSAIPGVFPPVVDGERVLVDGGCAEWYGCVAALDSGAERIVLVGCGGVRAAVSKWETFRHIWERSFDVTSRQNFERTLFALRGTGREILAIFPALPAGAALDFDRAPELIRAGRAEAERAVAEWERTHPVDGAAALVADFESSSA
jgi:NTE family protein